MPTCINKNSLEYLKLKKTSGIPDAILEPQVRGFMTRYERFPYLDEISLANSEPHLREFLNLKENNSIDNKKLLDKTVSKSVDEAIKKLNDEYRDLEITYLELGESSIINVEKRPTTNYKDIKRIENTNQNSNIVLNNFVHRLQSIYGVDINTVTNDEIQEDPQLSKIPEIQFSKGFIFNNQVYINLDNATIDTPVHELLHLVFGSMRYLNPDLYFGLIEYATQFKNLEETIKLYPNRTQGDILEEIFVTELAKELSTGHSQISNLPENIKYEIQYNMDRALDSMFKGDYSIKNVDNKYLLNFRSIGKLVNSKIFEVDINGRLGLTTIHRIMANTKEKLLREHKLEEHCE